MSMEFRAKLPIPKAIKLKYPLSQEVIDKKNKRDADIKKVFLGELDKFILVIGPCSADNEDAVMDYIHRLRVLQDKVDDKILIIPRIYTNKPRTTGEGYKGMLHQPDPNQKPDPIKGVLAIRNLHARAIAETGFSCADEMLYPENHRYVEDLLGYVAIGARSVENQQHRLVASGATMPVGMKNPTSGDYSVMLNSITAAQHAHDFIYRGWDVSSSGNELAHAILRGSVDKQGQAIPNYHYEDLLRVEELYEKSSLTNPSVIVDTNHNNSGKQYLEQIRIAKDIVHSRNQNPTIKRLVKGLMIESYLEDGAQKTDEHIFGKSITDPCLGWEKTEKLIFDIADKL